MKRHLIAGLMVVAMLTLGCGGDVAAASAETVVLKCSFKEFSENVFLTRYSDGTSPRIGVLPGIGHKALYYKGIQDEVFIELDVDGTPIRLITIYESGRKAYLSYHPLTPMDARMQSAPFQSTGTCSRVF